ncbi:hypothetical protein VTN49DRAFT_3207 [Thermomyces lanuginosus]|uniref:uncharacterized protein n=1 Tax=Thermomyces lanuginosus TaxID=5541 RepID=UPI0037432C39
MAANWRGRAAISDCSEMEEIYPRELKTFVMRSVVIFAFGGSLARGVRKGGTATTLGAEAANRHGAKCEKYGDIERTLTGRGIKGHTGTSKGGVSEGLAMTNDEDTADGQVKGKTESQLQILARTRSRWWRWRIAAVVIHGVNTAAFEQRRLASCE